MLKFPPVTRGLQAAVPARQPRRGQGGFQEMPPPPPHGPRPEVQWFWSYAYIGRGIKPGLRLHSPSGCRCQSSADPCEPAVGNTIIEGPSTSVVMALCFHARGCWIEPSFTHYSSQQPQAPER